MKMKEFGPGGRVSLVPPLDTSILRSTPYFRATPLGGRLQLTIPYLTSWFYCSMPQLDVC